MASGPPPGAGHRFTDEVTERLGTARLADVLPAADRDERATVHLGGAHQVTEAVQSPRPGVLQTQQPQQSVKVRPDVVAVAGPGHERVDLGGLPRPVREIAQPPQVGAELSQAGRNSVVT